MGRTEHFNAGADRDTEAEDVLGALGGAKKAEHMEDHELLHHLQQFHGTHPGVRDTGHLDEIRTSARQGLRKSQTKDVRFSMSGREVLMSTHSGEHDNRAWFHRQHGHAS